MERLRDHREYIAEFCLKTAFMAEAALIFGQFVPGRDINWIVFFVGSMVVLGFITFGAFLKKKSYLAQSNNICTA